MSVGYNLVNYSKKELVGFTHTGAKTARELAGNPVGAAISTWYMLSNSQDHIAFVSDTYDDWPFPSGTKNDLSTYKDVTDDIVKSLIGNEILTDDGIAWADTDKPELIYIRALRNIWMENS